MNPGIYPRSGPLYFAPAGRGNPLVKFMALNIRDFEVQLFQKGKAQERKCEPLRAAENLFSCLCLHTRGKKGGTGPEVWQVARNEGPGVH